MKRTNYWMGALLLALFWSGEAMAAVCTSQSAGSWNTATRWSCGGVARVPLTTDTVVIAHNITLDINTSIAGLTVNGGVSLVDNNANRVLTITGNLVVNGTINTGGGRISLDVTGAASDISGGGTLTSARLYISGAAVTIAAGSSLNFTGSSRLYTGRTEAGTTVAGSVLTINGTINSTVTTATTTFLRMYATSTVIGTTGVISASVSAVTFNNATATLTNNGSVSVNIITQNAASNSWTQGANAGLTMTAASTVGTLNASANGNTVTYNGTSTVIAPSAGYWNLAGSIFPAACPHGFTVLGTDPCPAGGPTSVTRNPGSCVNLAGVGALAWTPTPTTNVNTSDNAYATATATSAISTQLTNYLKCTGYGFAIPAGSTINGIVVKLERKISNVTSASGKDNDMKLLNAAGTIVGTNHATATAYTTADVIEAHGTSADTWTAGLTLADINNANFGAVYSGSITKTTTSTTRRITVDHMPITVTYTPPTSLHHIRIEHNGGACSGTGAPAQITIKACTDAACTTFYTTGNVTGITMSATGGGSTYTWSPANPQTITSASGGINSGITLTSSISTTAALAITGTASPAPTNAYDCYNANTGVSGVAGSAACNLVFSADTFSYNVLDHSSATRQVVALTSCKGTFTNKTRDVKFWSTYTNPATGTLQGKVVAGTGNADCATGYSNLGTSSASPTTLSLAFGAGTTPQATFSLCYPDVGNVKLDTRYDGTFANSDLGTVILGNDSFIAKPAGFVLSNIKRTSDNVANLGAANAGGTAFAKAGEAFTATVTAVNAQGAAMPNYGKETIPESVKLTPALVAGLGLTNNPAVSGSFGAFTGGAATGTAFKWDEVGIITLTPSVGDASYLGTGDVTGTTSGNVGRFSLGKFALQNIVFDNRADLCQGGVLVSDGVTACSPAFSYMGEEVDVNFTLEPMSLNDAVVRNYVDSATPANDFAKLDPSTFANLNMGAVDRATTGGPYYLTSRISNASMPVAACVDALCFLSGSAAVTVPFTLSRPNSPDGAYGAVNIGIAPVDSDGARVEGGGAAPGLCNNPNAVDCYDLDSDAIAGNDRALLATTDFRYGRMKLSNAHGSELLPLPITVTAQYWNSTAYVINAQDSESTFASAGVTFGPYTKNLNVGNYPNSGATAVTPASVVFTGGAANYQLAAPGAGNNGSVDMSVNVFSFLPSNVARATFGVYKGANEFIYLRENY